MIKNAVIYARYSSDKQTEQSIEGQVRECTSYALSKDLDVIDTYIDRALSGTVDNRPAFQQMIKDSSTGKFNNIIVYKTDRFARNRYDSAKYKSQLKKNGVKLHYAKEHIPDGIEGILMESLLEGMAEYYSAELSQKVKRCMRENILKGKYVGGVVPLGFKISNDKTYIIDEETAPVVRAIFNMKASGNTNVEILEYLNSLGLSSSKGYKYNKNSL